MGQKWKIITSVDDLIPAGIYQEKLIVVGEDADKMADLKASTLKKNPEAEQCEVPADILKLYPLSFGFWVNKTDPRVSKKDILNGSLRLLVTQ